MKQMIIYEPAMCCSTGVCGPSVDQELLRVSTVINKLKNKGITVERFNLSSNPQVFISQQEVNQLLNSKGLEVLPITIIDGHIVKMSQYPSNEEFCNMLDLPSNALDNRSFVMKPKSCCDQDGCC